MNPLPGITRLTADGAVGTSGRAIRVHSVCLVSASGNNSTVILKLGTTTGGTATEQIDGVASQSVTKNYSGGLFFPTGCFADVTFNSGDYLTVVYSEYKT